MVETDETMAPSGSRLARALAVLAALSTVALVMAALWCWVEAPHLSAAATRPDVLRWGVRCFAVAVGALAQLLAMTFVVGLFFRRDLPADVLRAGLALLGSLALVSSIALGLAGR